MDALLPCTERAAAKCIHTFVHSFIPPSSTGLLSAYFTGTWLCAAGIWHPLVGRLFFLHTHLSDPMVLRGETPRRPRRVPEPTLKSWLLVFA